MLGAGVCMEFGDDGPNPCPYGGYFGPTLGLRWASRSPTALFTPFPHDEHTGIVTALPENMHIIKSLWPPSSNSWDSKSGGR